MNPEDILYIYAVLDPRGGQQVSRTDTSVCAIHKPSGLAVVCGTERSLHANKELATERLSIALDEASVHSTWSMR
jgi:peptide chain release factor